MKRKILIIFTFFIAVLGYSQGNATISGRIVDDASKNPIALANITILQENTNHPITGTISDENGRFIIDGLNEGNYLLNIIMDGYGTKKIPILIGKLNQNFDIGKIEIKATKSDIKEKEINEVILTSKKESINSALDKKSFNIENNISQSGGSVLDAMRNLPGVSVDNEGKLILRGSDKVTVLIDGKQSSLTGFGNQKGLENIPASNIEQIEIISNPSAKYDSKGLAGVINIIYKKENKKGFNGDISLNLGVGELSKRKQNLPNIMDKYAFTPKINPAVNLNYRTQKMNIFLQADGIARRKVNANEFSTRDYSNGNPKVNSQFLENRTQQLYNIKGGLDWFINDNNKLTLYSLFEDEYHIDKGDVPYDYADGSRKRLWKWAEDENTRFINYSANFLHNFQQPGHTLEAGILYTKGGENELFPFKDFNETRNSTDETHLIVNEIITNFNLDYVKPLRFGRIELGSKVQLRSIPISYKINPGENSILDKNLGDWSKYKENIYSTYANLIHEGKKIDIEGGLRIEHTSINYNIDPANKYYTKNDAYNYFEFFPNLRLTYKPDAKNRISAFYNRRIDRPGEFDLRPFPKYDDPEILKTGNPYLRPQFTQTFEIAYKTRWKNGSVYLSGFYKMISDIFERIYTNDNLANTTVINAITQNLGKGKNIGFEIALDQKITDKWNTNASFNWYNNTINAFSGTSIYPYPQNFNFEESKNNTWNAKVNSSYHLPWNTDFQLTFVYYAPNIIPQGKVKERYSLDFGLKKKLWKDRAEVSLSATDILNTFSLRKTIFGNEFTLNADNYYETQVITLGMRYKF